MPAEPPRRRRRLRYADVAATVALVASLGGTAVAAVKITGAHIVDGTVASSDVKDRSLQARDLRTGAVDTRALADRGVRRADLANAAVDATKLADGSVTVAKLADGSVTAAKLAAGAVPGFTLADAAVTSAKLADGAVTAAKLAPGSVDGTAIADRSLTVADLAGAVALPQTFSFDAAPPAVGSTPPVTLFELAGLRLTAACNSNFPSTNVTWTATTDNGWITRSAVRLDSDANATDEDYDFDTGQILTNEFTIGVHARTTYRNAGGETLTAVWSVPPPASVGNRCQLAGYVVRIPAP